MSIPCTLFCTMSFNAIHYTTLLTTTLYYLLWLYTTCHNSILLAIALYYLLQLYTICYNSTLLATTLYYFLLCYTTLVYYLILLLLLAKPQLHLYNLEHVLVSKLLLVVHLVSIISCYILALCLE